MTTVDLDLYRRFKWFKEHAGYVVGRCADCALSLARAEQWADEQEDEGLLRVRWEDDPFADMIEGAREVYCALLETRDGGCACDDGPFADRCNHWTVRESLGGIADPDRDYARTIRAELASEMLHRELESAALAVPQL